jgi:hypothetical protein
MYEVCQNSLILSSESKLRMPISSWISIISRKCHFYYFYLTCVTFLWILRQTTLICKSLLSLMLLNSTSVIFVSLTDKAVCYVRPNIGDVLPISGFVMFSQREVSINKVADYRHPKMLRRNVKFLFPLTILLIKQCMTRRYLFQITEPLKLYHLISGN